uniref:C2H2-type domain-containing protein n=1 Tax=Oreochromis aureus TaxID=47969 RepID=A0AAZ1XTX4_OREAU
MRGHSAASGAEAGGCSGVPVSSAGSQLCLSDRAPAIRSCDLQLHLLTLPFLSLFAVNPQPDSAHPASEVGVQQKLSSQSDVITSDRSEQAPGAGSGRSFSCNVCSRDFSKRSNLSKRIHHLTVHGHQRPYACSHCGKAFGTRGHLRVHQAAGRWPLMCSACREMLATVCGLKKHRLTCQSAGQTFSRRADLSAHRRVHLQHKPFTCPTCGKGFTAPRSVRVHHRVHTGEKAFTCDICGRSFSVSANLRRHCLIHSGRRPFSCGVCGRSFTQAAHLKTHRRSHSEGKPFSCSQCGKTFATQAGVILHLRMHSGEKPFICEFCGRSFSVSQNLVRHKRVHSVNVTPQRTCVQRK